MRVVFVGKSHDFSMVPLRAISEYHDVVGIIESAPRTEKNSSIAKVRLLLSRWKARFGRRDSLFKIAGAAQVPYLYLSRGNLDRLGSFLKELKPDILCVASLSQLLKPEVIQIPKYGAINLHPSLLPKYHGPFPWFWQYYDFERECGVTVHAIDEGQDTGPIIKQESFILQTGTDIVDAMKVAASLGARLMLEAINEIEEGTAVFNPQPPHNYPKARIVRRDEKLIDWQQWPIERVWHVMRGTYPWLDAIEYPEHIKGTWRICEFERCACDDAPGQLYKDDKGYYLAHKEGKIRLLLEQTPFDRIKKYLKNS